jgi:hypothetical protein
LPGKGDAATARGYSAQATAWYVTRRESTSAEWREELSRLLDEARIVVLRRQWPKSMGRFLSGAATHRSIFAMLKIDPAHRFSVTTNSSPQPLQM